MAIDAKKGERIAILDVADLLVITDVFVIAGGTSRIHVLALADAVEAHLRLLDRKPLRSEGRTEGEWVLLDYGDVVVHLFDLPTRAYYDLERLWGDARRLEPAGAGH